MVTERQAGSSSRRATGRSPPRARTRPARTRSSQESSGGLREPARSPAARSRRPGPAQVIAAATRSVSRAACRSAHHRATGTAATVRSCERRRQIPARRVSAESLTGKPSSGHRAAPAPRRLESQGDVQSVAAPDADAAVVALAADQHLTIRLEIALVRGSPRRVGLEPAGRPESAMQRLSAARHLLGAPVGIRPGASAGAL